MFPLRHEYGLPAHQPLQMFRIPRTLHRDGRDGAFDDAKVLGRQFDAGRADIFVQAMQLRGAGNRNDPRLPGEQPRDRDLSRRHLLPGCNLPETIDQGLIRLARLRRDPTGWIALRILYSTSPPTTNLSRLTFPEYDRAAEQFLRAATEAERVAAARTATEVANNYAPFIPLVVRVDNWFVQPWVSGFSPPVIRTHWKYMDIDVARQAAKRRGN